MQRIAGWLAAACLVLAATPVTADRSLSLSYHGLRFLGLDAAQETALQNALTGAIAKARRLSLTAIRLGVSEACKRDVLCHCKAGREQQAARVLFGNIGHIGETFTFELVLVDTQSCAVTNSVFVSESHDPASVPQRLGGLVERLLIPQESVSQTAVKDERDVDAVPAIVTVFTAQQLRSLGIRDLSELLHFVPGFESVDTNWGDIVLHQGLSETLLIMIDGTPLYNPLYGFKYLGKDLSISLRHVDRIEFVRGPSSVLHGANALLGVVNLITETPTSTSPQFTAETTFGTLPTVDLYGSVKQSHRWFSYYVSGNFVANRQPGTLVLNSPWGYNTAGDRIWGNAGYANNDLGYYYDILARVDVLKRLQLGVSLLDHRNPFQISQEGSLLAAGQGGLWHKWHRLYTLAWEQPLPKGFKFRVSAARYEYRFWENYATYPAYEQAYTAGMRYLQGNEVEPLVTHLFEVRAHHDFQARRWGNKVLLGASYVPQSLPNLYADEVGITQAPNLTLDQSGKLFHTVSGYLQEDLRLWEFLNLSGGLRIEHREPSFGTVLLSQAGLLLRWPFFNAKLIYAEGFRPPSANYLYSTVGTEGNLALRPERSKALSYEAGTQVGPVWARAGGSFTWLTDQIVLAEVSRSSGPVSMPINLGSSEIIAAYGELGVEWSPLLSCFVNYSFKSLIEDAIDYPGITQRQTAIAPHTASLGLVLRPINDLSFYATAHLTSPRDVLSWVDTDGQVLPTPQMQRIGVAAGFSAGAWLTNLFKNFDIGLKLHNPFGIQHDSPYYLTGDPNYLLETRRVTEVLLTLRWSSSLDLGEAGSARRGPASAPAMARLP